MPPQTSLIGGARNDRDRPGIGRSGHWFNPHSLHQCALSLRSSNAWSPNEEDTDFRARATIMSKV